MWLTPQLMMVIAVGNKENFYFKKGLQCLKIVAVFIEIFLKLKLFFL